MTRIGIGCVAAAALLSAALAPATQAATPADTLVIAKNIDDIISLDPAEVFEFSGGEMINQLYDRVMAYEAEDTTKLVGGVAESYSVSDDGRTITLKIRPGLAFHSGNPVRAEDVAFSLQRVIKLNLTPAFILSQLGWTADNVAGMVKAVDDQTVELTIGEDFAPSFVLNCLSAGVGSVVDKKLVLANAAGRRSRPRMAEEPFRRLGRVPAQGLEGLSASCMEANPAHRFGAAGDEPGDHPPHPRALRPAPPAREGRRRHRAQSQPRPDRGDRRQRGPRRGGVPEGRHPLSRPQPEGRAPGQSQGTRGAALAGRLPGHRGQLPARPVQGAPGVLAVRLLRLADRYALPPGRGQGQRPACRSGVSRRLRGRARRRQHLSLERHGAGDPGDHGRGRGQGQHRARRAEAGDHQVPGAQSPDRAALLVARLHGPALQCRHLRAQPGQFRRCAIASRSRGATAGRSPS